MSCTGRTLQYINLGDTYSQTICQETDGEPFVGSWGNWHEEVESEHCESEGLIRCGYCGEFTARTDVEDWHNIECESCGHLVGG